MKYKKEVLMGLGMLAVLAIIVFGYFQLTRASILKDEPVREKIYQNYTFFATTTAQTVYGTTTSATSTNITAFTDESGNIDNGYFVIKGAKKVLVYFQRGDEVGGGNTGSSLFRIQTTADGTNWDDYFQLRNATTTLSTANEVFTLTGTSTITAASTTNIFDMYTLGWYAIRCIVKETTDGNHQCRASATW